MHIYIHIHIYIILLGKPNIQLPRRIMYVCVYIYVYIHIYIYIILLGNRIYAMVSIVSIVGLFCVYSRSLLTLIYIYISLLGNRIYTMFSVHPEQDRAHSLNRGEVLLMCC